MSNRRKLKPPKVKRRKPKATAAQQRNHDRRNAAFEALALATAQPQPMPLPTAGNMPRRTGSSRSGASS